MVSVCRSARFAPQASVTVTRALPPAASTTRPTYDFPRSRARPAWRMPRGSAASRVMRGLCAPANARAESMLMAVIGPIAVHRRAGAGPRRAGTDSVTTMG
jgi:hypothetical protein